MLDFKSCVAWLFYIARHQTRLFSLYLIYFVCWWRIFLLLLHTTKIYFFSLHLVDFFRNFSLFFCVEGCEMSFYSLIEVVKEDLGFDWDWIWWNFIEIEVFQMKICVFDDIFALFLCILCITANFDLLLHQKFKFWWNFLQFESYKIFVSIKNSLRSLKKFLKRLKLPENLNSMNNLPLV